MSIQVRSNEKPVTPPVATNAVSEGATASQPKEAQPSAPEATNQASEQNKPSESETEETEVEQGKETKTEDSPTEHGEPQDPDPENKEQPKKKGGFQRRIDKLNARMSAKEQELEYWKQQALKSAGGAKTEPEVKSTIQTATTDGKPKPENFNTHTEYVEALTDWKTEQKLKEHDQKAEKNRLETEQSKIVGTYTERMKAFAEKTADFNEVLGEVDHVPLSPALRDIILTSENGPELAYELAKNPVEYERIAKLPPLSCAREMGKLEFRLNSAKGSTSNPGTKKITNAPKPIEPVGTGGKGSASKSIYDSSLSQKEFEALRREQMKKRRQAF